LPHPYLQIALQGACQGLLLRTAPASLPTRSRIIAAQHRGQSRHEQLRVDIANWKGQVRHRVHHCSGLRAC
jgi:hypothetical protein